MSIKAKIITGIVIVALAGSGGSYAWWRNQQANEQQRQEQADRAANEGRVTEEQASGDESGNDEQTPPGQHDSFTQISVTMNSPVDGQQVTGNTVSVRAVLNGTTSGTCTVTFSKSGYTNVVEAAPVMQAPTYYTCQGFDVPKSKFPAGGAWKVQLKVTAPSAEGNSEERTITL